MRERENSGRTQDPVEEAGGGSFPASDPPAWTVARAGKPEARAGATSIGRRPLERARCAPVAPVCAFAHKCEVRAASRRRRQPCVRPT